MADQKLTDRAEITIPQDNFWVHVVNPDDKSEDPAGTSKKMMRSDFLGAIFTQLFTALSDTPNTYTGQGSKLVIVNPTEAGLQFTENVFIGQQDTPVDYTGDDGKVVTVKTGGGLEFLFQTFLNLQDVSETTFQYQEGKAVTVDVSDADPGVYSLKFTDLPTYEDIYGGNAIIKGGLIKRPGANLDFTIWGEKYIIDGQFLQIPIRGDVTNSPGDATFDRQDVYFIETDNANPPNITVGILEGTPSANPSIPTLDLSTQVQVSVTLVKANATVDPNLSIETIYDELAGLPTEWTNTVIPTGADMAYAIDPAVGTFSILLAAIAASDTMTFLNDSDINYVGEDKLVFYIKTVLTFTAKSRIGFKLINSGSGDYWNLTVSPTTLRNYGYNPSNVDWQLIQINLSDFVANNRSATLYDTLEITFTATPVFGMDWIVLQGGVPNPSADAQSFNEHSNTNFPTPQNRDKIQYDGVTDTFINRYDLGALNYYNLDYEFVAPIPVGTFPLGVVAFDNVDPALTTTVEFSLTNLAGQDSEQFLKQIQVGDAFTFFSFDNLANAEVFTVTVTPTISATTAAIGVSYNAGDSTGTGLVIGERLDVQWLFNRSEFKQYTALSKPNPTYKEGLTFYDFTKKALSYYNDDATQTVNLFSADQILGWGNYSDDEVAGQTITTTASKLVINGLGASSNNDYLPREIRGISELWDVATNKITPITLGDGYTLRIDVEILTEVANPNEILTQLDIGGAATPTIVILDRLSSTGRTAPYVISAGFPVYTLATFLTNGGQIFMSTDSGSVTLGSKAISIHRISKGDL